MLVEENYLMHDELKAKLQHISKTEEIPDEVFGYGSYQGQVGFRNALAKYMEKNWFMRKTSGDNICV